MIARVWRGIARIEKADDYLEHFKRSVLPELNQLEGFKGACVLRRDLASGVEITVQTFWESLDSIRKFAGEKVETAVVADTAKPLFHNYDLTATHHQVLWESRA